MNKIKQIFKNKDIINKFLFTMLCITLFRIGSTIPLPFINPESIKKLIQMNDLFSLYEMVSGGTLEQPSLFSLGITPYITASIVINLFSFVLKSLEDLSQEGDIGQKKIKRYTLMLTLFIAVMQAIGFTEIRFKYYLPKDTILFKSLTVACLVLGVYLLTVMDKKIEKKGLGKGASLIICSSILSKLPKTIKTIVNLIQKDPKQLPIIIGLIAGIILLIALVIQVQESTRKVYINYAKHSTTEDVSIDSSYLPLKLNQSGITPIIFAQTFLSIPQLILMLFPKFGIASKTVKLLGSNVLVFNILLTINIIFFNYFYTLIAFDTSKLADNLRKAHGFIDEVKPGDETAIYLERIMLNLMVIGNVFLIFVALMPTAISHIVAINTTLMGTSLLIITSTFLDSFKQVSAEVTSGKDRHFFNLNN